MSITRNRLSFERNFVQVPNEWMRDKRLSRRARGLLAEIMTHSVGWEITVESLVENGPEGRDAIRGAISELESAGYLTRQTTRSGGKFSGTDYMIQEPLVPAPENPTLVNHSENAAPAPEKPTLAEPHQRTPSFQEDSLLPPVVKSEASANQELALEIPRTEVAVISNPARMIAQDVHERTKGAYTFKASYGIIAWAIKAGYPETQVHATIGRLWAAGRPLTKALLGQALEGIIQPTPQGQKLSTTEERMHRGMAVRDLYKQQESQHENHLKGITT